MRLKNIFSLILVVSMMAIFPPVVGKTADNEDFTNLKIVYMSPTDVKSSNGSWTYAGIPIGNGKIGAKVYGGVDKDVYQLNDASFWSGGPEYTDVYDESGARKQALNNTRELLAGDLTDWTNIQAIESSAKKMVGSNVAGSYMPVGNLVLNFSDGKSYSNYNRTLNLDTATVTTSYSQNGVTYKRTAFSSYPDNVIVIKLEADVNDSLNVNAALTFPDEKIPGQGSEALRAESDNEYSMSWRAPVIADSDTWSDDYGMTIESRIRIIETDGTVTASSNGLNLSGANEAVILYSSETSYNGFDKNPTVGSGEEKDYKALVESYINDASEKGYDELYRRHLDDYQSLFNRLWVDIEGDSAHVLAYQFKRYEMIACNRQDDFFNMGYGMWNVQMHPTSWGNHYMNENVIKQNSFIESANLAEMQEPVINWLGNLAENGQKTARYDFGFRGWMAPHHSDIWAVTSLQGDGSKRTEWSIFPVGGMWTNLLVWEHYQYSMDTDYLKNTPYPLFEGAAEFVCDWLIEREFTKDEITGEPGTYLVTSPSTSAENSYGLNYGADYKSGLFQAVSVGTTQDMTIVRAVFEQYIETCEILGIENSLLEEVKDKYKRLLPYQIHKDGELQEWAFEQMKPNKERALYSSHRHASQLIGLWPYNFINESTPELYKAAEIALTNRGSGNAARMPDKAAMLLRLGKVDEALEYMPTDKNSLIGQWTAAYQNTFSEFIMQSQNGYIDLLPALPTSWKSGAIKGIRSRGGYDMDITWNNGELVSCIIYAQNGNTSPDVRYNGEKLDILSDSRITVVDTSKEAVEADNITAQISDIVRDENEIKFDYTVKSEDNNTATNIYAILAVYENTEYGQILKNTQIKSGKVYNNGSIMGRVSFDASDFIGDGKKYGFKAMVWKKSNICPLADEKSLHDMEFKVKKQYHSSNDFSNAQGPVWRYQYTTDNQSFMDLDSYNESGNYWGGNYSWLRVGGSFMHPDNASAVRTFIAPSDGHVRILESTLKAEDNSGTADGIRIKIVKNNGEQVYPVNSDEYREIGKQEHLSGVKIPEIELDLTKGDQIHFILNQGERNAHDGTIWTNIVEYVD